VKDGLGILFDKGSSKKAFQGKLKDGFIFEGKIFDGTSNGSQVSISIMFYEQLFNTKVFFELFSNYSLAIFLAKHIGRKAAHKMLMKLTTG